MKTIIAGSRGITDLRLLSRVLSMIPWKVTSIISGGAKGVDSLAEYYASSTGIPIVIMEADWEKNGKSAGYIRNRAMVAEAEATLCIWDGQSKGTLNTINLSKSKGIPTFVYTVINADFDAFKIEYFNERKDND